MAPRFIKLHPRTRTKLKQLMIESASDKAYRVSTRIQAVLLNADKKTSTQVAEALMKSRSKVSEWLQIYENQGVDGLLEGFRAGRPSRLTDVQKTILCDIIDSGPVSYGLDNGIWTAKLIKEIIQDEFNVTYHPSHVWKLLTEFGFSVQSPKRVLAKADAAKKARWTEVTYPDIKKKPTKKTPL